MNLHSPNDFRSNFYTRCMSGYFRLRGRTPRWDYWLFSLVLSSLYLIALVISSAREQAVYVYNDANNYDIALGFLYIAIAIHFIPSISAGIRRLHDTNRSAWMILISLIPLIGGIVLLVFYAQKGTGGPNEYGPDPYGDEGLILGSSSSIFANRSASTIDTHPLAANRDVVSEIERLAEMRRAGTLTETEFEVLKARAMNSATA